MPKKELSNQVRLKNVIPLTGAFIAIILLYFLIVKTEARFTDTFKNLTKKVDTPYNQPPKVTNPSTTKIKISEEDTGREITIALGQQIVLILQSKIADSKWHLVAPFDSSILKLTEIKFKEANSKVTRPTPIEEWTFQGAKTGRVEINLTYDTPWDKPSQTGKIETYIISVH